MFLSRNAAIVLAALGLMTACSQPSTQSNSPAVGSPVVVANGQVTPRAVGSPSAAGPVQIALVQIEAQDAVVTLQNTGGPNTPSTIDLHDWKLQVGTVSVTLPEGATVAPRQNLSIHTGPQAGVTPSPSAVASVVPSGAPNTNLYLTQNGSVLRDALKPGAQVELIDSKGVIVSQYTVS